MATTIFDLIDLHRGAGTIYLPPEDDFSDGARISNSYYLHDLALKIKNDKWVSVSEVFQNMEIYEDIFSSAIHGSIDIFDGSGGFSNFLITGGETLRMTVCKSVDNPDIIVSRDDFIVYKVTDMRRPEQGIMRYTLHFISQKAITSQTNRLYRTFQNENKISSLVKLIYGTGASASDLYLKVDDNKCKIDREFVSPGYTELQAIDTLAKRACASGDYYLFFERLNKLQGKKHVFTSMENMKNRVDAFNTGEIYLMYNVTSSFFTIANSKRYQVQSVSFVDNYNQMENLLAGLFNSGIRILDITSRSFTDMKASYIGETKSTTEQTINTSNFFLNAPGESGAKIIARSTNDITSNGGSWLKIDTVNSVIISLFRLIADMPGNNMLGVGNYVTLVLPSDKAISLNIGAGVVESDPHYTGKYLITAVKHSFGVKEYTKKLELSRIDAPIKIDTVISNA